VALEGNELRHDVVQVTVSFSKHRMVDPTSVEDDTRRLLKRRAFDHLLTLRSAASRKHMANAGPATRTRSAAQQAGGAGSRTLGFGNDTDAAAGEAPPIRGRWNSESRISTPSSAPSARAC